MSHSIPLQPLEAYSRPAQVDTAMTSHYAPPAYRTDQRAPSPSHSRYDSYDAPSVYPQSHAPTIREVHAPSTLARRDTFATLAPGDSISNAPSRLNDDRHVQSDFDEDYLLRDPYARTQTPNDHLAMPYGAPAGHEYDYEPTDDKSHHRYSSYDAPLVANAGPAGGSQHEYEAVNGLEKGGNDYPPPAPNLKSEFGGKRPGLLRRWIRDPTPLEQRVENYKRGIGVQARLSFSR